MSFNHSNNKSKNDNSDNSHNDNTVSTDAETQNTNYKRTNIESYNINSKFNQQFYMPPEWHTKQATFMEFPVRHEIWDNINIARNAYANVANAISEFEKVYMLVKHDAFKEAKTLCSSQIELIEIEHDDSWMRDNGPTFVINQHKTSSQKLVGINWNFNAWGEKYKPYNLDNQVATKILKKFDIDMINCSVTLEGGAFHVNGDGVLLATKECILNKNRNNKKASGEYFTEQDFELIFKKYLGIDKCIWLELGLYGDETDGHIDNVACFASENHIIIQGTQDKLDPNYAIFHDNLQTINSATNLHDKNFDVTVLQAPPIRYHNNERLTLSYINYYMVNSAIILPVFGDDAKHTDEMAVAKLKEIFPNRKIIAIDGSEIIKGGGNVHCITQQMPLL